MKNKYILGLAVLVVLVVGVYLLASQKNVVPKKFGGESNLDILCSNVQGLRNEAGITSGGSVCTGSVKLTLVGSQATGTVAWQNTLGTAVIIPYADAFYTNSASTSHIFEMGTSSSSGFGVSYYTDQTGTYMDEFLATTTVGHLIMATTTGGTGRVLQDYPVLAPLDWLIFRVRPAFACNGPVGADKLSCVFATSTDKGFNINISFDYRY